MADVNEFINSLAMLFVLTPTFFLWRPTLREPFDEHALEAAISGQADAIVTFNIRHFRAATARFGIVILRPGGALRRLQL